MKPTQLNIIYTITHRQLHWWATDAAPVSFDTLLFNWTFLSTTDPCLFGQIV